MPARTRCKHCKRPSWYLKRLLCKRCYYTPEIRELYPIKPVQERTDGSVVANSYQSNSNLRPRILPRQATDARPGTLEKIMILEQRADAGEDLFHPDDLTAIVSTFEWAHGTDCL